ncbi:MAG: restriction endonuclease subunit S [bacterium]|nr:restriction endonuclease subunit S [Candidatus Limimorpha equi]
MEGLEISEVRLSEVQLSHKDIRVDAEFYQRKYLDNRRYLNEKSYPKLSSIADTFGGYAYASDAFGCDGISIATIADINASMPVDSWNKITIKEYNKFPSNALGKNDILIGATHHNYWDLGKLLLIYNQPQYEITYNQRIFNIRARINQLFLFIVLQTSFVRLQIEILGRGNNQLNLSKYDLDNLQIPVLSDSFQLQIGKNVDCAYQYLSKSKSLYSKAEDILLSELGLKDWQPNNAPVNIKQLKESFLTSGRLDAEYYQTKYDEIENIIKNYKNGTEIIGDLFTQNTEVCDFKEESYNYIEIGDINISDGTAKYNLISKEELPDNAKRVLHKNDILISKVRPYRGAVSIIDFDDDKLIGSGAFTVLHEKTTYKKEVLQILLRTQVYRDWLLKWNVGSSYPVIKDEDILNLPIPILPMPIQETISAKIQESFALKAESRRLLDQAKLMVEREIEKE